VASATTGTAKTPPPLKWADEVDIDTAHEPGIEKRQQMIEVPEPPGDSTIRPSVELRHRTTPSSRYSSVEYAEDMGKRSDGEESVTVPQYLRKEKEQCRI
jgi:hypothetical protein